MCTCTHLLSESPSYHMNWTENNKLLKIKDKTTIKQLYFPRELNIFFFEYDKKFTWIYVDFSILLIYIYMCIYKKLDIFHCTGDKTRFEGEKKVK